MPGIVAIQVNAAARARAWSGAMPRSRCSRSSSAPAHRLPGRPLDAQGLDDARRRESRTALKRLLVAAFGAMQAMMFAPTLYPGARPR